MKKRLMLWSLAIGMGMSALSVNAQYVNQVVVANGGVFEFQAPFADYATMGVYNPHLGTYTTFDTIFTQSVQQVTVDEGRAYVAAQDSVIVYDLNTLQRAGSIAFASVRSVTIQGNYLIVGKWFGSGDYLEVYDKMTLALEFSVPEIDNRVDGAAIIGDTLYVPYNTAGTIDQCPPFGCFSDTIGKIGVIDLVSQGFVRDINLDTLGNSAGKIYTTGTSIHVVSAQNDILTSYNNATGMMTTLNIDVETAYAFRGSEIMGVYSGNLGLYDVDAQQFTNSNVIAGFNAAGDYDNVNDEFYITETDFSGYGLVHRLDASGNILDTDSVQISPEGLAIDFRNGNGAPHAVNDSATTDNVNPFVIDVQQNDVDPNGDMLTTAVITDVTNGSTTVLTDGSIEYLAPWTFMGMDSLQYSVCDQGNPVLCDTAWVYLNVNNDVGVTELTNDQQITLYPNPGSDRLELRSDRHLTGTVELLDVTGRVVLQESLSGNSTRILNTETLPAGTYLLRMQGSTVWQERWIKQ